MSFGRTQIDAGANFIRAQGPGDSVLDQTQQYNITTAGAGTLPAAALSGGLIERTGPGAGYIDTLDTADNLMAANPNLSIGDSWEFTYRNTVAFAATIAVAEGAELFGSFTGVALSTARRFLITVLSTARRVGFTASTVNATPTISGLTQAQAQQLQPGMGVSGTGITGGTTVTAVNSVAGTVTLSANATATGSNALTFFPRYNIRGLSQASL